MHLILIASATEPREPSFILVHFPVIVKWDYACAAFARV